MSLVFVCSGTMPNHNYKIIINYLIKPTTVTKTFIPNECDSVNMRGAGLYHTLMNANMWIKLHKNNSTK